MFATHTLKPLPNGRVAVVVKATGKTVGLHPNRSKAFAHLKSLNIAAPPASAPAPGAK